MKPRARDQIGGVMREVPKGATTTLPKVEVRDPAIIRASITTQPAELAVLQPGQQATAIIEASEVIIGV
jgi:molybdopterin-binding protein